MLEAGTAASEEAARTLQQGGGIVHGDFRRLVLCVSHRQTAGNSAIDMNYPETRLRDLSNTDDRDMAV